MTETEAGVFVPMYCKDKVYCGIEEFSFEELRALRWKAKKRALENRRRKEEERVIAAQQEDLLRKQEMLRQRMAEFQMQREQFEREKMSMFSKLQEKFLERDQQLEEASQQHLQTQRDQVERDIERRMQQQEQAPRHSPQSVAKEQVKRSGITAAPSAALGQRSLSPQQDEMDTQALGGNSLQTSTSTPSNNKSWLNSSGSSGSSGGRRTGPTPDRNKRSLTAPSPTVCTKEAMNIVMGMFNSSLNIDKNLGWDDGGTENISLPQQSGKDKWL